MIRKENIILVYVLFIKSSTVCKNTKTCICKHDAVHIWGSYTLLDITFYFSSTWFLLVVGHLLVKNHFRRRTFFSCFTAHFYFFLLLCFFVCWKILYTFLCGYPGLGVLDYSAKPAFRSSHTVPPGYIRWTGHGFLAYLDWLTCTATPLSGLAD